MAIAGGKRRFGESPPNTQPAPPEAHIALWQPEDRCRSNIDGAILKNVCTRTSYQL